jgi:hypothetical protein
METVVVRYRVKADRSAENEAYIRKVFEQLHKEKPTGISYSAYQLDDGVSFVHVASIEPRKGKNPLAALASFQAFVEKIKQRCEELPVVADATIIGTFNSIYGADKGIR